MKKAVRKTLASLDSAIAFVLFYSGFVYIFSRIYARNRVTIAFYHEIGDDRGVLGKAAVSPQTFKKQIQYMAGLYNGISLNDLHGCLEGKNPVPRYPLVVTYDGGFIGNHTHAYPVLKKHRIPATIYLVTEYLEKQVTPWQFRLRYIIKNTPRNSFAVTLVDFDKTFRLSDLDERISCSYELGRYLAAMQPEEREAIVDSFARELDIPVDSIPSNLFLTAKEIGALGADELIDFGSHTLSHPSLVAIPSEEAHREISESKLRIEKLTGKETASFCYPYGHFSEDTKTLVAQSGYDSATTTAFGLNSKSADRYELKRIGIQDVPLFIFAAELSGLYRSGTMLTLLDKIKKGFGANRSETDTE